MTQVRPAVSSRFDLDLGVTEAVAAANQRLGVQLLRATIERAPAAIAERLGLEQSTSVLWVERVIRVNDVPAAHAIDAIPEPPSSARLPTTVARSTASSRSTAASSSSAASPT